jgi:hypothetical protein
MKKFVGSKFKKIAALSAVAFSVFGASQAHAFPLVTDWGVTLNSGFTAYTETGGSSPVTGSNTNGVLGAPSTLSWGYGNQGQSSISVAGGSNGSYAGTIYTGMPGVQTVEFAHNNRPINGSSLSTATLTDLITLQPLAPWAGPILPAALQFAIKFKETGNGGTANDCAAASSVPCADIFTIDVSGTGASIAADYSINQLIQLSADPVDWYNVKLVLEGFGLLSDKACAAAGAANGCIGFATEEERLNVFHAKLSIQKVPEPGMLALFGIGLLGAGFARRRKIY